MTDRRPHLPTAATRLLGATVLAGGFLLAGAAHPALAGASVRGYDNYENQNENENDYNYDDEGDWPCPEDTTTTTEAPETTTTTEAPETTTTEAPVTTAAPTTTVVKVLDVTTAAPTTTVAAADPKVKQLALTGGSSAPLALAGGVMILTGSVALRRSSRRDEV